MRVESIARPGLRDPLSGVTQRAPAPEGRAGKPEQEAHRLNSKAAPDSAARLRTLDVRV